MCTTTIAYAVAITNGGDDDNMEAMTKLVEEGSIVLFCADLDDARDVLNQEVELVD